MNTFQLECFLAVAQTLSFARASEQLNITQPAVTHQIHSLEDELNTKLFKRTTRNVELTHEGLTFINDAKNILEISMYAIKRFETHSENDILSFSIGCIGNAVILRLYEIMKELRAEYPNIAPRFKVAPFSQLIGMLNEDDADVILSFAEDDIKFTGVYKELKKEPVFCICSDKNPISEYNCISVSEIKKEKAIICDPVKSPSKIAQLQSNLIEGRKITDFLFCESPEEVNMFVNAGYGVSILPESFIVPSYNIVKVPIEDIQPLSFGAYYKSLKSSDILKSFMKIAYTIFTSE